MKQTVVPAQYLQIALDLAGGFLGTAMPLPLLLALETVLTLALSLGFSWAASKVSVLRKCLL